MKRFRVLKMACMVFVVCVATAIASAQTLTTLQGFNGTDGSEPWAGLLLGYDGNFYGTTAYGGAYKDGSVFRITTGGTLTTLYSFAGPDGSNPESTLVQGTDGNLYGTTSYGGTNNDGTVFKITTAGVLTTLHNFSGTDGGLPSGTLVQGTDGNFYGTTQIGGSANDGTIFKITPSGALTTLYSFCSLTKCEDGYDPVAGLIQATDGNFYGTTWSYGAYGYGTVFKIAPTGKLTTLHSFDWTDGSYPSAELVQGTDGNFYGTTTQGGVTGAYGTVFKITPTGVLTTLHSFCLPPTSCLDGARPTAGLVQATDGNFYGTTWQGGASSDGTIFKITPAGTLTTLHNFTGADGTGPDGGLVQFTDGNLYGTTYGGGAYNDGTVFQLAVGLQPFTSLFSFDGTDGEYPSALAQGTDGGLYGESAVGGAYNYGTVLKITTTGTLTTLYSFCTQTNCTDGAGPDGGLILATDGNLYGTTGEGGDTLPDPCTYTYGNFGCGTVFKISSAGTLTTLHVFVGTDGFQPSTGVLQATDGNFYGTTFRGGAYTSCVTFIGCGTVFKITPAGTLTTLYSFCAQTNCPDGYGPGGLVQANNGNFYGTTGGGGAYGYGTVFKITPAGTLTTLYSFCAQTNCPDGSGPGGGLIQAADGNFYGTTYEGGPVTSLCPLGCGTVFKITPTGILTTLHTFAGTDGSLPDGWLIQATDGNFYGMTDENYFGNPSIGSGTVFKITPTGILTTLHSFAGTDGAGPEGRLVQATDGNLYGTTYGGGNLSLCEDFGCGTVFKLSLGMGPFVEAQPTSGIVGAPVIILGTNLTGTTKVGFNGTAATFTVVSSSEITTTVPAGATTGSVAVLTPSGALKSNLAFRVTPQILSFSPTSGTVGTVVTITGVSLTQTKAVAFGGVPATQFTVISDTEVTATVPTGARTGHLAILTSGGSATSSGTFTVTQ